MIYPTVLKNEEQIKRQIMANLRKEVWPKLGRRPSTHEAVQMIAKILDEAYASGIHYDMSGLIGSVAGFAAQSTNHSSECLAIVARMRFKSEDISSPIPDSAAEEAPLVFFDCEVFPNLFLINWKFQGKGQPIVRMINPSPDEVKRLFSYRLVGFNNKAYDNIILWARSQGVTIQGLYEISRRIIVFKERDIGSREAKNISYADIYDFSSKKQSLKKFEIELSRKNPELRHLELNMDWNKPVPQERWLEVSEYCDNDVIATEATFEDRKADFAARKVLAELAGGTVNDSTNSLSARFVFEGVKNPQSEFNYRFMGKMPDKVFRSRADAETGVIFNNFGDEYTLFDEEGRPIFKGYTYERVNGKGVSKYRGEIVGEGGYVFAKPGIYTNVALLDIESMHPHSAIAEKVFGDYYTERFRQIVEARLAIKHKDLDRARTMLNGVLAPYLDDPDLVKGLAGALKIVINSVYGESYAAFKNAFRDPRNIDNIIAKRGALFMVNLKHEVLARGFEVAHIKTDSIKIPNATPEIIKFVQDYGEQYGYHFQHEATYERMCLVNDAVYIARYSDKDGCMKQYGYIPEKNDEHGLEWTATGTQFAVPYVFKSLFTKEPIDFYDLCEIKSVTTSMVLDMNEKLPDVSLYEDELDKLYFPKKADQHGKAAARRTNLSAEELEAKIAEGHFYRFVGRVGEFCPIKPGCFGGELLRVSEVEVPETGQKITRYSSVTGAKGYRWLESEVVRSSGREGDIDLSYYETLAQKAVDTISQFGDFETFVNGDINDIKFNPYPIIDPDATPF